MTPSIRILIADDHPLFRGGLRALLDSVADTEVVGEAATGEEAVAAALSLVPDVVVMDINMPGLNGIEATRRILDQTDDVNVLVMTMHDDDEAVFAAIRAGARGYQLKGAAQEETLRAIRSVANGEAIFGPAIADRLQRFLATPPASIPVSRSRSSPTASSRSCSSSHCARRMRRSRRRSSSARRRCGTTSRRSSRSSRSPTGPRPAWSRGPPASESSRSSSD